MTSWLFSIGWPDNTCVKRRELNSDLNGTEEMVVKRSERKSIQMERRDGSKVAKMVPNLSVRKRKKA